MKLSFFVVLAGGLGSSAALAQPAPPPLNLSSGDAKIVITPSGVGNIARTISCPTCGVSGGGAFPITAAGATQSVGQMTVTGSNAGMAMVPNGTGSIMLAVPDATAAGGNARGIYAVDLQTSRAAANQVVSGSYSMAMGLNNLVSSQDSVAIGTANAVTGAGKGAAWGYGNTVTGQAGALGISHNAQNLGGGYPVAIGYGNIVSGQSSIALGESVIVRGKWSVGIGGNTNDRSNSGGFFLGASSGSFKTQSETYVLTFNTNGATAGRLTFDASAASATTVGPTLPSWTGFAFDAMTIVAKDNTALGFTTFTCTSGLVYRVTPASSTVMTGGVCSAGNTLGTIAVFGAVPTITADTTNAALNITVTPPAGNTNNILFGVVVRGTFL